MSFLRVDHRSLRFRLLAWLVSTALVLVSVTWFLHGILLEGLARDFLGDRLRKEAAYTIERIQRNGAVDQPWIEAYTLASEVFHHLYVLRVGDQTSTSHPKWLIPLASKLEGRGPTLEDIHWQGRHLLVYRQDFVVNGQQGALLLGEDYAQVEIGLKRLHWWVGMAAALLLLLLIGLNLVAVNRGLLPLARLRQQLADLQSGRRERLELDASSELDSLILQINHFMDEIEHQLTHSRNALANLSHALKTPLAAVSQVLRSKHPIDDERRKKMLIRIDNMQQQVASELRRARFAGPNTGQLVFVKREAETLLDMLKTLYPDKDFRLECSVADTFSVPIERQDLAEMLGILLDNAGKWSTESVVCRIRPDHGLSIEVEDDGRGVDTLDIDRLGQRNTRLDESQPGHGLGLSILKQLVSRYGGEVAFTEGRHCGLRVRISLPLHRR